MSSVTPSPAAAAAAAATAVFMHQDWIEALVPNSVGSAAADGGSAVTGVLELRRVLPPAQLKVSAIALQAREAPQWGNVRGLFLRIEPKHHLTYSNDRVRHHFTNCASSCLSPIPT